MSHIFRSEKFSYFSCDIDPDDPRIYLAIQEDYEAELERNKYLKHHDPNRIDGRRINRKGVENLGLRVNQLDASCPHW